VTEGAATDDGSLDLPGIELRQVAASLRSRLFERPAEPIRIGAFILLERVGEGRMGVVYAAYDEKLDRKVAVKIQRAGLGDAPEHGHRLLREAHALARLCHPNIVQVFAAGDVEGRWFIAMEFVRGRTLRRWLAEPRGDWRETLAVYLQAGRGLAAAHAVGLVHRDFKPDNIMLGDDGRVRVLDFGLARAHEFETQPASDGELPVELTATGQILGTPAYMAPEQFLGLPIDARADQFSFCVAVWEALFHGRPFVGDGFAGLRDSVLAGRIQEPSGGARIPPWLRRALTRGLSRAPEARFASLDALLEALSPGPPQRRRWLAVVGGLATLGAASAGAFALRETPGERCSASAMQRGAALFDASTRGALRQAVTAAHSGVLAQRLEHRIDASITDWQDTLRETCEATFVRGEQSAGRMDLRMDCLRGQARELTAQLRLFAAGEPEVIDRAFEALDRLPSPARCVDPETAALAEPEDPATRAVVAELRGESIEIAALARVGREREALPRAIAVLERARTTGHSPVIAETQVQLGELRARLDQYTTAAAELFAALTIARRGGYRQVVLRAMAGLAEVDGVRLSRTQEGLRWLDMAEAELGDPRSDPALAAELLDHRGAIDLFNNDHTAASAALHRGIELADANLGAGHTTTVSLRIRLARLLWSLARYDESAAVLELARVAVIRDLGEDHPKVADVLDELGRLELLQSRHEAALALYRRSTGLRLRARGERHSSLAISLNGEAVALCGLDRFPEAGPRFEQALALLEATYGPHHISLATQLDNLAAYADVIRDLPLARRYTERSLRIREAALPPEHPELTRSYTALGWNQLGEGDNEGALRSYERALAQREGQQFHPILLGRARLGVARSLVRLGRELPRAHALLTAAIEDFRRHGPNAADERLMAEDLLREMDAARQGVEAVGDAAAERRDEMH